MSLCSDEQMEWEPSHARSPVWVSTTAHSSGRTQHAMSTQERLRTKECQDTLCSRLRACCQHSRDPRLSQPAARGRSVLLSCGQLFRASLVLLGLLVSVTSVLADYVFEDSETASTADVSTPLPRPFDATACGLQHLAQQQALLQALQQLPPNAARQVLRNEAMEALKRAEDSQLVVEEVQIPSAFVWRPPAARVVTRKCQIVIFR